jgi:hypothetical protein
MDEAYKRAKEAYDNVSGHNYMGLPDSFEFLTPSQKVYFVDFFLSCKNVDYSHEQREDCIDELLDEVGYRLGEDGETIVENIIYKNNLKIIRDNQ